MNLRKYQMVTSTNMDFFKDNNMPLEKQKDVNINL